MMAGARLKLIDNKESNGFCFMEILKTRRTFWKSPWGMGRPGWHIECSAMSQPLSWGNL